MRLKGLSTSPQIVIGEVLRFVPFSYEEGLRIYEKQEKTEELEHYQKAKEMAFNELNDLGEFLQKNNSSNFDFVSAHKEILNDPVMDEEIKKLIEEQLYCADSAIDIVFERYIELFSKNKNTLIHERASDMQDVKSRLIRCYYGKPEKNLAKLLKPCIIVAQELFPSDTLCLDTENIKGIITENGSLTSHTAIIARTMGIPALLSAENVMSVVEDGDGIILDGSKQEVVVGADQEELDKYLEKALEVEKDMEMTKHYYNKEPVTLDGAKIDLRINIASSEFKEPEKVECVDGVGLFRSEFLYLSRKSLPTEDEQFLAYKEIAEIFKSKPVVLRTLDIGGDKQVAYMDLPKEDNPFLGNRGLRLCLSKEEIFRTQIRAVLRASAYGNLMMMFPMVTSINEYREAKTLVKNVMQELDKQKIPYNEKIKIGIMIEVPSIALIMDQVIDEIDFASVGTNDLCQYLCAADRMNGEVKKYYQDYHPAVFRVLKKLVDVFEKSGKCLSICGELAGDALAIPLLAGIGIRTLSMNDTSIARAKRIICNIKMDDARTLATNVLNMATDMEVEKALKEFDKNVQK